MRQRVEAGPFSQANYPPAVPLPLRHFQKDICPGPGTASHTDPQRALMIGQNHRGPGGAVCCEEPRRPLSPPLTGVCRCLLEQGRGQAARAPGGPQHGPGLLTDNLGIRLCCKGEVETVAR
ncbi:hypothetical protein DPEC_G00227760 [Dallia pectoralis]|uniref:Uncharacterized protein n=1 Tax=Dallia pectoralis TaxID=75939 RepID=A0ACC2G196_DALPE|nr:hypothetical protein DPEC_G00227760 [Dallia pectoralis]